jgi:hypothetical protein
MCVFAGSSENTPLVTRWRWEDLVFQNPLHNVLWLALWNEQNAFVDIRVLLRFGSFFYLGIEESISYQNEGLWLLMLCIEIIGPNLISYSVAGAVGLQCQLWLCSETEAIRFQGVETWTDDSEVVYSYQWTILFKRYMHKLYQESLSETLSTGEQWLWTGTGTNAQASSYKSFASSSFPFFTPNTTSCTRIKRTIPPCHVSQPKRPYHISYALLLSEAST